MPRYLIGSKKRQPRSFSLDPDLITKAEGKLLRGQNLSAIVEALIQGWVDGTYVIEGAKPGAPVTP